MKKHRYFQALFILSMGLLVNMFVVNCGSDSTGGKMISDSYANKVIEEMVAEFGQPNTGRIETGVKQVQSLWKSKDGTKEDFRNFCTEYFIKDPKTLNAAFQRLQGTFENVTGLFTEMRRELNWHLDVDTGPILDVDYLIATLNPESHLDEDFYSSKIAFFVLLNYQRKGLQELLELGPELTREQWAQARMAGYFEERVPSGVSQKIHESYTAADAYISSYNIYMGHLLDENGNRLFPEDLKLISHWGLRDELKSQYAEPDGLARQKMIYEVMQHIIAQDIPEKVINNPEIDWAVYSNELVNTEAEYSPEPDRRYEHLLRNFKVQRESDQYYPTYENYIQRSFEKYREIPEEKVKALFIKLLTSDEFKRTGKLIQSKLGRILEPFDIWYTGFRGGSEYPESKLDVLVQEKYPTVEAFEENVPNILVKLGYDWDTAAFLASKIEVDPARGAGHAMGAERRSDKAHLRTRVPEGGMDYKGYNIAIHELGHNVEQVFSLNRIDHTLLSGVPNTAFTEAFAFVFQSRDLDVLGLETTNEQAQYFDAVNSVWGACEIAGVSLVDIGVWHWMYEHPEATPAELKEATIGIAKDVWNEYFSLVFGTQDSPILAIYSHMIDYPLYLPNYPLGQIIQFQIEEYIADKNLAKEMERMCRIGNVTPDYWMQQAVGKPIAVEPMLRAAKQALDEIS